MRLENRSSKRIPTEIHDHPMDDVITEQQWYRPETDNRRRMTMDAKLQELCRQAHEDRIRVGMLDTDTKNRTLELAADALMAHEQEILEYQCNRYGAGT